VATKSKQAALKPETIIKSFQIWAAYKLCHSFWGYLELILFLSVKHWNLPQMVPMPCCLIMLHAPKQQNHFLT